MPAEVRFLCSLPQGLHARPASMLADGLRGLDVEAKLERIGGQTVDAKSVLSIVGLDVKLGDECILSVRGAQEAQAIGVVRALVGGGWAKAESAHAPSGPVVMTGHARKIELPRGLREHQVAHATGIPACPGIARGRAVFASGLSLRSDLKSAKATSPSEEMASVTRAIAVVTANLRSRSDRAASGLERDLLAAHAQIAADPSLESAIRERVNTGSTAAQAVVLAAEQFMDQLRRAASEYVRDRVIDVQDVAMQIVDVLAGGSGGTGAVALAGDSIVFADVLTPSQLMQLDRNLLKGLVLGSVGATSHTVILARSLSVPTLLDAHEARTLAAPGDAVILDADRGLVVRGHTPVVQRHYDAAERTKRRRRERLAPVAQRPGATHDGTPLEVGANASTSAEVQIAIAQGAQGVGLLRTEMLFLDRADAPTESEQFNAYADVVESAGGRPVIIRTLDIGGDKPAAYIPMADEENPFLGCRGIRMYPQNLPLIHAQLRAILRASARGPVKVMAPMVSVAGEAAWFRDQVRAAQRQLAAEGTPFDTNMPVGVMIEVPSVSLAIEELSGIVDFFSIGTNDLCQYWMAVDRGNTGVASLYNCREPSFLRLLAGIVRAARGRGRWIGMCGEMAGDRRNLPLLVGMGLDEISVAPGAALELKALLASLDAQACRTTLAGALACGTPEEVDQLLSTASLGGPAASSVVDEDAIVISSGARDKCEAIREAVDALYVAGRTDKPDAVEDAIWAREATYSTGLGYGFAIPHCASVGVSAASLAVVKLQNPVDWGSNDGQPVRMVLLLAVPASDTAGAHMKVFAKLARKLMHDEFRKCLNDASDAAGILHALRVNLEL